MLLDMAMVEPVLQERLRGLRSGRTSVECVDVRRGEDSEGEPALFLDLTLSDPPDGHETWPTDDIWDLREQVSEVVAGVEDVTGPWFINFYPGASDELEPDDVRELLGL
jgi:hypothetical protein